MQLFGADAIILLKTLSYFFASELHSVLEQIWIKDSYLDQRLLQHESLYPIGLKSARIKIPHIGSHYIFFKNWFLLIQKTALQ